VTRDYDAVVFDLGGVLAEVTGVPRMRELTGIGSDEALWHKWLTCDWVRRFERGGCSPAEFATGVVTDWALGVSAETFLDEFRGWLVGALPGAEQLVAQTRAVVRVACLSNTNRVHWEAGANQWPLVGMLDHTFLSFELGMVKPDREIFEHVVTVLATEPDRVLFLDDNELNVRQARQAGLAAERAVGVSGARRALVAAGVLPSGSAGAGGPGVSAAQSSRSRLG
jgi:putative hydrolase of the HAD superfamily